MQNWDNLRFLLAVYKTGTMTAAAKYMNSNVATVSRRLERLGEQLGYPPFVRTPQGWEPNKRILGLLDTIESFDANVQREVHRALDQATTERVSVRIGVPPVVASRILYPSLRTQMTDLRGVAIEIYDRFHGEGLGEFDLVIQAQRPEAGRLVTTRVGHLTFGVFGPETAHDTGDWVGLTADYNPYPAMQMAYRRFQSDPAIRTHHFDHLFEISKYSGLPGPMTSLHAAQDPSFRLLDDPENCITTEFWVMYHASRQGDPAIKRTLDWIKAAFFDARATPET